MGVLRLLLAISVVFGHVSFSGAFTGPTIAVETFYIISGFYIGLVLDTTAAYRSVTDFYINRYLRLFPVYLVVAVFAVILALRADPAAMQEFLALPPVARALLAFSNATLFLQDWVMFLGIQGGHLHMVRNVHAAQPRPLYEFLAIPPAWSLGCELTFYLLAPFLVRLRDRWLLCVIGLSLLARGGGLALGLHDDPWSYRFFPFELAMFGLGVMTYRLYSRHRYTWIQDRRLRVPLIAIFFCLTIVLSGVTLPGKRRSIWPLRA